MTVTERIVLYKQFLDAVLSAGPDIQDDLTDLAFIRDAAARIAMRTARRFGKSAASHEEVLGENQWKEIRSDGEVATLEEQVFSKAASVKKSAVPGNTGAAASASDALAGKVFGAGAEANKGALTDLLQQIFQFLMANPALLQLIIQLFKPKV